MIEIAYGVTLEEIQAAKKLLIAAVPIAKVHRARFGRGIFGWVLFIGLAIALFFILDKRPANSSAMPTNSAPAAHTIWATIAFLCGIAGVIIGFWLLGRLRHRAEQRSINKFTKWVFQGQGLEQIAGPKRTLWYWRRFSSFAETDSLFVLRESSQTGRVLPKRLIPDNQTLERVRALLVEHIVTPAPQPA